MKKLNLIRQNYESPDFDKLNAMRKNLEELLLSEPDMKDSSWSEIIHEISDFQYRDGSFNLLDSYRIESDCRVYYCHEATYICTALLMKALVADRNALGGREKEILAPALHMCCARGLEGHGFGSFRGKSSAINYFLKGDVREFLRRYPELCPEFTERFESIKKQFCERVEQEKFTGDWGEGCEKSIHEIHEYLTGNLVFVYGTLMKGESNHQAFLRSGVYVGDGVLNGYEMYDLGSYPGIVNGKGRVIGEVYRITDEELERIDSLEGEGFLYLRTPVTVRMENNTKVRALAYVYNHSINGCARLKGKYGKQDYVWYVAYGSNLLEERLSYYIQGGYCAANGRKYSPCSDSTMPTETRPVTIPYNMYYAKYGEGAWKNSAVSFLDISKPGKAYGRAYKVTRKQLEEIHRKEGKNANWYPECIELESINGLPAYTFARRRLHAMEPFNRVSAEYGIVLLKGMMETYPEMGMDEVVEYLRCCGR